MNWYMSVMWHHEETLTPLSTTVSGRWEFGRCIFTWLTIPTLHSPHLKLLALQMTCVKHNVFLKPDLTTVLLISFEGKIVTFSQFVFGLQGYYRRQTQAASLISITHPKRSARTIFQTFRQAISSRRFWCVLKTATMKNLVFEHCHLVKSLREVKHYHQAVDKRSRKNILLLHE